MLPAIPDFLKPLLARPVAVFGGGASGLAAVELLGVLGARGEVYDVQARDARREFGEDEARRHGLVIFSPGFEPGHPWLAAAWAGGALCLGELDFASIFWSGRIVAVTGTNGKTTLTEFLTHALKEDGADAHAAGNIGHPFSMLVAETAGANADALAICEVSSFQAETLRHFRADAAIWTNFAEDHLERHQGMDAYLRAKTQLAARADSMFAGSSVPPLARSAVRVETAGLPRDPQLEGTVFADYPQRENFVLAAAWWRAQGRGSERLHAAARSFRLGSHRLALVDEVAGVSYWNDSKATNFHAVEAALARFAAPVLLIAGGKSKGGDLAGFARRIASRVKRIFLIGETGPALAALCAAAGVAAELCASLGEAVRRAAAAAVAGDTVLLSPGFASFDQFRGYAVRGEQFERHVRSLKGANLK